MCINVCVKTYSYSKDSPKFDIHFQPKYSTNSIEEQLQINHLRYFYKYTHVIVDIDNFSIILTVKREK
jgi:hypothetical protein